MNKVNIFLFFLIFTLSGCGNDIETITIKRSGLITLYIEGEMETWSTDKFNVYPGQSIVKVFEGEPNVSVLFKRYNLVFKGTSPNGDDFELTLTFDVNSEHDLRHTFLTDYDVTFGGLNQMSLIIAKKSGRDISYSMAQLCPDYAKEAQFMVDRQNISERLMAGSLKGILCFEEPSMGQLRIVSAQFTDIKY